jgi:hypothetical protein
LKKDHSLSIGASTEMERIPRALAATILVFVFILVLAGIGLGFGP